jgi:hypothetical protein
MEEGLHYPPGAEPEKPQEPETPQVETPPQDTPAADPAPETPEADATATDPAPETEPNPDGEQPQDPKINKRSIYDDYKDKKQEAKDAKAEAEAAKARVVELEALLQKSANAQTPADQSVADEDLKSFAETEGLSVEGLKKLTDFLGKRIGNAKLPDDIEKELGELRTWKQSTEATQQRVNEDREIDAQAPVVKTQLKEFGHEIHDEAEATAVMNEIKRLAHTKEFHDKPLDYIVYARRAALAKMISPKKPSFESSTPDTAEPVGPADFSKGRVTPQQAQRAIEGNNGSAFDIRQTR